MSSIDNLLRELAPDGVPARPLGELGSFIRGNGLQKVDLIDEGTPAIHYGQIHTSYGVWTDRTLSFTDPAYALKLRRAQTGNLLIATTSEDDDAVAKATAWLGDGEVAISGDAYIYRHSLDPRYVSYFFQSIHFQRQKARFITGTKVRRISDDSLAKILIPEPPRAVQEEIVRILDRFTKLEVELNEELALRRQQYEHYRTTLIADELDAATWSKLGVVADVRVGQAPPTGVPAKDGEFAFVNAGTTESGRSPVQNTVGKTITIPSRGQGGVGVVGYQAEPFWCGPLCYRINSKAGDLETRFLYYFLKSIQPTIRGLQQTGGTPALNRKELVLVNVPVLSPDVYERVVSVLDKFDALIDPSGIPAELAARRNQYEYYRDQLLTFPEVES
jgi:type I restriction enzyme S subunit